VHCTSDKVVPIGLGIGGKIPRDIGESNPVPASGL